MAYTPRLNKSGMANSPYWYSSANPYYNSAYQLPNCTTYAYGRWLELGYSTQYLGRGDAQQWYPNTKDIGQLVCSQIPRLGAIACWRRGDGKRGHVGVVERILASGNIQVSMSGYKRPLTYPIEDMLKFFWLEDELQSLNYRTPNWMIVYNQDGSVNSSQSYYLQGFIYPAGTAPSYEWVHRETDQSPNMTHAEKENNAQIIYMYLSSKGWSLESICAVLGNMETESYLNPGQCELGQGLPGYNLIDGVPTSAYYRAGKGLGLIGWTDLYYNGVHYPNGCLYYAMQLSEAWFDGYQQLDLLDEEDDRRWIELGTGVACSGWQYNADYPQYDDTLQEFKTNAKGRSIAELTREFLYVRERPADPAATEATRISQAQAWYTYLSGIGPINPPFDPGDPTDPIRRGMPIYAMIRYH